MAYIKLLRSNATLRRLSVIQLICYFGAWFSNMAIYSLLIDLHASAWILSMVAVLTFLPTMILAPFSGVLVDKLPTKPLMMALFIIEIVTVCMLLFINSLETVWLLFILVFIRMGTGSMYFQTEMSLLPTFLRVNDLKLANEIHSMIWSISYTAGMGLAGFFVYLFGVKAAFAADAVLFCIGFALLVNTTVPSLIRDKSQKVFFMLKDGFLYIKKNPKIFHIILLHASVGAATYDALVALLADNIYQALIAAPLVIGFINSSRAFALSVSSAIWSRFVSVRTFHLFFFAQGCGVILWGILQFDFYLAFIGVLAAGFFSSTIWAYTYTLLQQSTKKGYYGRVIAYNDMFIMAVSSFISFLIGFLFSFGFGLSGITIFLGVLFFVSGVYWLWVRKNYFAE